MNDHTVSPTVLKRPLRSHPTQSPEVRCVTAGWEAAGKWQPELSEGIEGAETLYPQLPESAPNEGELPQRASEHVQKASLTPQD